MKKLNLEKISGKWVQPVELQETNCDICIFCINGTCENDGFECMHDKLHNHRAVTFQERDRLTFRDQKSTKNWNSFLNISEIIKNEHI